MIVERRHARHVDRLGRGQQIHRPRGPDDVHEAARRLLGMPRVRERLGDRQAHGQQGGVDRRRTVTGGRSTVGRAGHGRVDFMQRVEHRGQRPIRERTGAVVQGAHDRLEPVVAPPGAKLTNSQRISGAGVRDQAGIRQNFHRRCEVATLHRPPGPRQCLEPRYCQGRLGTQASRLVMATHVASLTPVC